MRKFWAALPMALVILTSVASAKTDAASRIEVTNVKVGLACISTMLEPGGTGWVCHAMKDIYVVDQGTCVYDKRNVPCTWTGLEFDYKDAKPGAELVCSVTSSKPTRLGNPDISAKNDTEQFSYPLSLEQSAGHHFEAQYVVFQPHDADSSTIAQNTRCSLDGRVVFSFDQVFHYPVESR